MSVATNTALIVASIHLTKQLMQKKRFCLYAEVIYFLL